MIHEHIRKLRQNKRISIMQMSRHLKISAVEYCHMENGRKKFTRYFLKRMMTLFRGTSEINTKKKFSFSLKKGATRWVFVTEKYCFKIPALRSYKNFLTGLLSNMQEVEFSRVRYYKPYVCPVFFYIPFGLLVVMPTIDICEWENTCSGYLYLFSRRKHFTIPAESKPDSWGRYKGHLVAVDYG